MARKRKTAYTVGYKFGLNLRENPSKEARILRVMPYGCAVEIESEAETTDGWVAIKGGGYVMAEYLK